MSSGTFNHIFVRAGTVPAAFGIITKADLEHASCGACYRPLKEGFYCQRCLASGAATRHRMNPNRLGAPE